MVIGFGEDEVAVGLKNNKMPTDVQGRNTQLYVVGSNICSYHFYFRFHTSHEPCEITFDKAQDEYDQAQTSLLGVS
jgi:hypothetical protein